MHEGPQEAQDGGEATGGRVSVGRGTAEGVPEARWGVERTFRSIPGASPVLFLCPSFLLLPDPGV